MLETAGPFAASEIAHRAWLGRVGHVSSALGWNCGTAVVRPHVASASLALPAPVDQLYVAADVAEWAWEVQCVEMTGTTAADYPSDRARLLQPHHDDIEAACAYFREQQARDREPSLTDLLDAAAGRGLSTVLDEDQLTIGAGAGAKSWMRSDLPASTDLSWADIGDVPVVLVTGSNGKTTTVRLLAAMAAAAGKIAGYCCTDGVRVGGLKLATGDYSGPEGARLVLRDPKVEIAVLESARGGMLRRGLAVNRADAAIVTNVSADHFGEYGVESLSDLADVKFIVVRAIGPSGLVVLNADDPVLMARVESLACPLGLFSVDFEAQSLVAHRRKGGATCGVAAGRMLLTSGGNVPVLTDLGAVSGMPLSIGGSAAYNISNMAGAALIAVKLGIATKEIAGVLARFGGSRLDNPGRLEIWRMGGVTVLMDYAHNPEGLAGLLTVAHSQCKQDSRLGLVLGQAGNRDDQAIRDLARVAAGFRPDFIVTKDTVGYLRGRAQGEVPAIIRAELAALGFDDGKCTTVLDEISAARTLIAWARQGDVIVLPVHHRDSQKAVGDALDAMHDSGWEPGMSLPGALP